MVREITGDDRRRRTAKRIAQDPNDPVEVARIVEDFRQEDAALNEWEALAQLPEMGREELEALLWILDSCAPAARGWDTHHRVMHGVVTTMTKTALQKIQRQEEAGDPGKPAPGL